MYIYKKIFRTDKKNRRCDISFFYFFVKIGTLHIYHNFTGDFVLRVLIIIIIIIIKIITFIQIVCNIKQNTQ